MTKIGVILGSARDARSGDKPAQWFMDLAKERDDMQFELLDLRDYNLPFFNEVASNAWVPTQDEAAKRRPSAGSKSSGSLTRTLSSHRNTTTDRPLS